MPIAIYALTLAAFAIGTTEFVIAGILPTVSADFGVTIPVAGYLVSLYALGVALGGPVLTLLTGRFSRRALLVAYTAIFVLGHVVCALAPTYPLLLIARVGVALIHGAFFGAAMVTATLLVPPNRRGSAIALVLAGLTVSNIIGVPIGTAIGMAFGWRATFWSVAGLGAIGLVAIVTLIPRQVGGSETPPSFGSQFRVLARPLVLMSFGAISLQTIGQFALFTYISPFLTTETHLAPELVPWFLLLFGVGATTGVLIGGRLADWKLMPSLILNLLIQIVGYAIIALIPEAIFAVAVLIFIWGATGFAFGSLIQARILANAGDAPRLVASLTPSAFNLAIALGAWLGGVLIAGGQPYAVLPWVGVITTGTATALLALSTRWPSAPAAEIANP